MSADKRQVATDALETLGQIITENEKRDAIHLAVEPVVAGEDLFAGQHINIVDGKAMLGGKDSLGIVDPFLPSKVAKGQMFWLVIYPRQITSLRHVWEHPELDRLVGEKYEAEQWLRNFANKNDVPFDFMIESTRYGGQEYVHSGSIEISAYFDDTYYDYLEKYTGEKVDEEEGRVRGFSCAC